VTEQTFFGDRVHLHLSLASGQPVLIDARPQAVQAGTEEMTVECATEDLAVIANA
jgi:spermidine/putrescine transport system ATP-binding protein